MNREVAYWCIAPFLNDKRSDSKATGVENWRQFRTLPPKIGEDGRNVWVNVTGSALLIGRLSAVWEIWVQMSKK